MCKQADIQEFQKKLSAAAPQTEEGTSAADSTDRAADTGGSSPPAETRSGLFY